MRTEQITVMASYPAPGSTPRGLAWDGEHLWHADEAQSHNLRDMCALFKCGSCGLTPIIDRRPGKFSSFSSFSFATCIRKIRNNSPIHHKIDDCHKDAYTKLGSI